MTSKDIENEIAALQAALEQESSPLIILDLFNKQSKLKIELVKVQADERKARILQEKQKQTKLL